MEAKYKIGDKVWYATSGNREKKVLCPECFGKTYLTVILGDDSQVRIWCVSCQVRSEWSYEDISTGYVKYYEWFAEPKLVEITGLEISQTKVDYRSSCGPSSWWNIEEGRAFDTEEEARVKADQLAEEHNQEELDRINKKEKHNRTWAWNVHYHRDCIKEAERKLEYHRAKFLTAKSHLKEDRGLKVNDGK